ncbi:hypothetical protein [Lysinibacillus sp. SGAir0095]|nr:hypothetical protein [Lysinibacillus sp. SGAir0095]
MGKCIMKVMKHFLKGNQVGEVHHEGDEALSEGESSWRSASWWG